MKLGVIGDDFTGSSDIGLMLASTGLKTVQYVGTPDAPAKSDVDIGIIALKSRSTPIPDAVGESLQAMQWLKDQGCRQIMFKYCSTFDSTKEGNIGPVIDALIDGLDCDDPVVVCPAVPTVGRTLYHGHLFVFDKLLSESGMQHHPLTPMTDPDIRRWLQYQTKHQVGHLPLSTLRQGNAYEALLQLKTDGHKLIVCDAIEMDDLAVLNEATESFTLTTGGSGIGYRPYLANSAEARNQSWAGEQGATILLSGSCSNATRAQVKAHANQGGAQLKVEVGQLMNGSQTAEAAVEWAMTQQSLPLIYTSDDPDQVKSMQERYGTEAASSTVENFFSDVARLAVDAGATSIISAGGETSGAVVGALNAKALEIGPMIDPGVPALRVQGRSLVLALKSGNFGAEDFFAKAAGVMTQS